MKLVSKILVAVLLNLGGLFAARFWIPNFELVANLRDIVIIALVLTALNFVLKPILKLILGPVIVLTLGLGLIVVNALILKVLDFSFDALTIGTSLALLEATILFGAVNIIFHLATKK